MPTTVALKRATLRLLSLAAPAAALAVVPVPGADAAGLRAEVVVTATDEAGDVRLLAGQGPTRAERRSIDLREVTVVRRAEALRLTVRIKELLAGADFDQMVFVSMLPTTGSDATWEMTGGLSVQKPDLSYAYLFGDGAGGSQYETCDPLDATVRWRRESVRLDIPWRCVPEEPARIRLSSATGFFRSDAGTWSKDALRIPGAHVLP